MNLMPVLLSILIGGALGYVGNIIMKNSNSQGMIYNIFSGILGSILGTTVFGNWGPVIWGYALIPGLLGTILVIWLVSFFLKK